MFADLLCIRLGCHVVDQHNCLVSLGQLLYLRPPVDHAYMASEQLGIRDPPLCILYIQIPFSVKNLKTLTLQSGWVPAKYGSIAKAVQCNPKETSKGDGLNVQYCTRGHPLVQVWESTPIDNTSSEFMQCLGPSVLY